jgi:hypothetical protein
MQMDKDEEQPEKAEGSTPKSLESASNVTAESFSHSPKHLSQRVSTDEGMQMLESDEQR